MQRNIKFGKTKLLVKSALQLSIALLLGLLFFSMQVFSTGSANTLVAGTVKDYPHTLSTFKSSTIPFSNPFKPGALPFKQEMPDENEQDDNPDSDIDKLPVTFVDEGLKLRQGETHFVLYSSSIGTRAGVSLFILHHSWKSFLL